MYFHLVPHKTYINRFRFRINTFYYGVISFCHNFTGLENRISLKSTCWEEYGLTSTGASVWKDEEVLQGTVRWSQNNVIIGMSLHCVYKQH